MLGDTGLPGLAGLPGLKEEKGDNLALLIG